MGLIVWINGKHGTEDLSNSNLTTTYFCDTKQCKDGTHSLKIDTGKYVSFSDNEIFHYPRNLTYTGWFKYTREQITTRRVIYSFRPNDGRNGHAIEYNPASKQISFNLRG